MHAFTDGLKLTKEGLSDVASGLGKGLQSISSTVEQGFKSDDQHEHDGVPTQRNQDVPSHPTTTTAQLPGAPPIPNSSSAPTPASSTPHSKSDPPLTPASAPSTLFNSLSSTLTSTTTSLLSTPASAAKSGVNLALTTTRDATATGLSIGTSIARSGLDAGADVVSLTTDTVSLAGTALGGVVVAAAETSGAAFEPIGSGLKTLKALEGLEHLGQGVEAINGLSLGAVKKVSELTTKALNMSGKTPTFFDPDADGIVRVPDTVRGLVLLGLDEKNATYAAYALHTVFSYSTSDNWVPTLDKSLPIRVAKMAGTRWGKNWGNFERLEWVDDVEIDKFFVPQKSQKALSDYWKQGRQGFGALLLIFEWGTTWPFYMPPLTIPVHQIPFANDIGSVVRKAILPTIVTNFKKARALNPQPQAQKSSAKAPEDPINMPGEFTG